MSKNILVRVILAPLQESMRYKHAREDSNLQPLVPKTSALSN